LRTVAEVESDIDGGQGVAASGESIDMEACFSQLTLDVIGKAVFNYDFDALNTSSPLIQAR
jgi:carotene epsilon-monooxygenase